MNAIVKALLGEANFHSPEEKAQLAQVRQAAQKPPVRRASDYHRSSADDDLIRSQRRNQARYRRIRKFF